jgi:hypothetical protein
MCLLHRILSNRCLAIIVVDFARELINSMELHPSLEAVSPAASQEISCILSNLKTHYDVHVRSSAFPLPVSN